ncbi:hypothetical protein, partial [Myxococcus xanthus]|uniref:hypothetical protein n=1 Tax=Myxococcus xanthus TaxID=34 RepID=UPI001C10234C
VQRGGGRWAGEVNGALESGPLDGVYFRARVQARTRTAVLEHLVAWRPNPAKLRDLRRQACASARQVSSTAEPGLVGLGPVKVNGPESEQARE